jgi:hypothetical protein
MAFFAFSIFTVMTNFQAFKIPVILDNPSRRPAVPCETQYSQMRSHFGCIGAICFSGYASQRSSNHIYEKEIWSVLPNQWGLNFWKHSLGRRRQLRLLTEIRMSFQFPGVTINVFLLAISDEPNLWKSKIKLEFRTSGEGNLHQLRWPDPNVGDHFQWFLQKTYKRQHLSIVLHILRDYRSITTPLKDIGNPRPCGTASGI